MECRRNGFLAGLVFGSELYNLASGDLPTHGLGRAECGSLYLLDSQLRLIQSNLHQI
jgi:hypothetical protein